MSTITKEWLQQTIAEMEEHRDLFPGDLDDNHWKVLSALRIALASLEAEAVGEVVLGEYDDCGCHPDAKVVCIAADGQADWENFKDGTRLYTAPPEPASVPDDFDFSRLAFEKWITENYDSRIMRSGTGYAGRVLNQMWQCWLACRAAMLHGAEPVSNRDEFPDGWVACSERMPHIGVPVITCCGDVVQYAAYAWDGKAWQDWYEEYDKLPANTFTHWHPRPAAPK